MTVHELAAPEPVRTVELSAVALLGALTDLERTAGRDQTLPTLRGVMLYTETDRGGNNRLYGSSTNRFLFGQAWEECQGALPPVFVDLEGIALMRNVLRFAHPALPAVLHVRDTEPNDPPALDLSILDLATVAIPTRESYMFPRMEKLVSNYPAGSDAGAAALQPQFVAALALIGKRRRQPLRLSFGQTNRASTIDIGDNYRAMIMPVNMPDTDREFRYAFPEARRGKA